MGQCLTDGEMYAGGSRYGTEFCQADGAVMG